MATSQAQASEASASTPQPSTTTNGAKKVYKPRYIDIGINLTDPVFTGLYYGTQRHPNDLCGVLQRAKEAGCEKLIVTGSDMKESRHAVQHAREHPGIAHATIGVHPCNCSQFADSPSPSKILDELKTLAIEAKASKHAVAFGEIGLDYDRLEHCSKEVQLQYFEAQLSLAVDVQLPLFLHSRAAHADFLSILSKYEDNLPKKGVVHSFTGTKEEMWDLVNRGWDIGINGCSMKTAENCEVVKELPLERLQVETDGPWCEMRASHASADFLLEMGVGVKVVRIEKASGKPNGKTNGKPNGKMKGSADGIGSVEQKTGAAESTASKEQVNAAGEYVEAGEKEGQAEPEPEEAEDQNGELQEWKSVKKERWSEGMMIKGRNEPCMIGHVAWAIAGIKGISVKEVSEAAWSNSVRMFGAGED